MSISLSLALKKLWIPLGNLRDTVCLNINLHYYIVFLISSEYEWKEIWDKESVNKYLDILETATVLEQIHDKFAGMTS